MRLDEFGQWVSDDGAYVWDEAAQTWQPTASRPPAPASDASSAIPHGAGDRGGDPFGVESARTGDPFAAPAATDPGAGTGGWHLSGGAATATPAGNATSNWPPATTGGWSGRAPDQSGGSVTAAGTPSPWSERPSPSAATYPSAASGVPGDTGSWEPQPREGSTGGWPVPSPGTGPTSWSDVGAPPAGGGPTGATSGELPLGPTSGGFPLGPGTGELPPGPTSGGFPLGPASGGLVTGPAIWPEAGGAGAAGRSIGPTTDGLPLGPGTGGFSIGYGTDTGATALPTGVTGWAEPPRPESAPTAFSAGADWGPAAAGTEVAWNGAPSTDWAGQGTIGGTPDLWRDTAGETGPSPLVGAGDEAPEGVVAGVDADGSTSPGSARSLFRTRAGGDGPPERRRFRKGAFDDSAEDDETDDDDEDDRSARSRRRREGSGRRRILIAAVMAVLLVGVGLAVVLLRGSDGDGAPAETTAARGGRYNAAVRTNYMRDCLAESNGNQSYCNCTLQKLEAGYSQEEYLRFNADVRSDRSQQIIREIFTACRNLR
jgi:hypothetical protein